jgi:hypothetical protein
MWLMMRVAWPAPPGPANGRRYRVHYPRTIADPVRYPDAVV